MIAEQKCPNCGGALIFDPAMGKLRCEFCDSIFDVPQAAPKPQPRVDTRQRDAALAQMQPLPVYVCRSCGAEVVTPAQTTGSLTCPYCSNNIVLTQQFSGFRILIAASLAITLAVSSNLAKILSAPAAKSSRPSLSFASPRRRCFIRTPSMNFSGVPLGLKKTGSSEAALAAVSEL